MDYCDFFNDKIILIFGGTGSIGCEIVNQLLKYNPRTIRIFSNSENELWETKLKFGKNIDKLRFLLGDIRDYERVKRAVNNVDYIFNAAAIKHITFAEYNPVETINVNIHGLENIIEASFEYRIKKIIHISTDKAVNPTTVMGATKMLGERLCISRDLAKGIHKTKISCVRFGNVLGSRGSIIPLIKNQIKYGNKVSLTDVNMKRFFMSIKDAVNLVLKSMILAQGGEIFVLKMPTIMIKDLIEIVIENFAPKYGKDPKSIEIKLIGSRKAEKINEDLISPIELPFCYEIKDMFLIYPFGESNEILASNNILKNAKIVNNNKNINYSTLNQDPLKKLEIKKILEKLDLL